MAKTPLDRLVALVGRLRAPKGCPWDREQTHVSLIKFLREEARELERALRRGRPHEIEDELGDVLLQVLLHAEIAREGGLFGIQDVARAQYLKLRRRHPHVFGRRRFRTAREVLANWDEIKSAERRLRERDLRRRGLGARAAAALLALGLLSGAAGAEEEIRLAPRLARARVDGTLLPPLPGIGSGFDGDVNVLLAQPDGRMLALGAFDSYAGHGGLHGIARLERDGSLDLKFKAKASKPLSEGGRYDCAALLPGWRIAAGGFFTSYGGHPANGLIRMSPLGGMDKLFLDQTVLLTSVSDEGSALRVRSVTAAPGGGMLIAGDFDFRPSILLLQEDGSPQRHYQAPPAFKAFAGFHNDASVLVAVGRDGRAVLAGTWRSERGAPVGRVARLQLDGSLDRTFSAPDFRGDEPFIRAISLDPDGGVLVGGYFDQVGGLRAPNLARLDPRGRPDPAFLRALGAGFGAGAARRVNAMARLKDGTVAVGGGFGIGRLRRDGSVDAAFARNASYGLDGPVRALAAGVDGAIWIGGAFAGVGDPKTAAPAWNRCAASEDCRAVRLPCGDWEFAHRLYAADLEAHHEKRRAGADCVFLEYPRPVPACVAGTCAAAP